MRLRVVDDVCARGSIAQRSPAQAGTEVGRPRFHAARVGVRLLAVLPWLLLPAACQHSDNRISMDELATLEQEITEQPPVAVQPTDLALTDWQPYQVRRGDVLAVQMVGLADERYAETTLQLRVHNDGRIILPVVGPIAVEGLDLGETEQAIIAAHVPDIVKDLTVYVELTGPESTTVLVQGAAAAPGLIKLPQNERNVLYALAAAGGFGGASSGRVRVRPIRPERTELVYDLSSVNDVRRALLAPPLESGDTLVVEAAPTSAVYVLGLLNDPGPIVLPPNSSLSMMRAIAASGGVIDFLEPDEATLWRKLADGRQVRVKIDLAAVMDGETPDFALQPGDILDVPHTAKTRMRQWFVENIRLGPFGLTAVYDPVSDYRARILRNNTQNNGLLRQTLLQSLGAGISELVIPPVTAPAR